MFANTCERKKNHIRPRRASSFIDVLMDKLIISSTAQIPAYTAQSYIMIIHWALFQTRLPPPLYLFIYIFKPTIWTCDRVCSCERDRFNAASLETQWSHLISHASDALMNQHTPACQQRGVVVKYTGVHFSQNCYLKHGKYSCCALSDKDGAFLDELNSFPI